MKKEHRLKFQADRLVMLNRALATIPSLSLSLFLSRWMRRTEALWLTGRRWLTIGPRGEPFGCDGGTGLRWLYSCRCLHVFENCCGRSSSGKVGISVWGFDCVSLCCVCSMIWHWQTLCHTLDTWVWVVEVGVTLMEVEPLLLWLPFARPFAP